MDLLSMIMMIEDNSDDAELVRYAFGKAGVLNPLVVLEDGTKAISYIEGTGIYGDRGQYPHPGLVLLDLKLPRRSGWEVLEAIRANDMTRHTPVVILTSSTQDADIRRPY